MISSAFFCEVEFSSKNGIFAEQFWKRGAYISATILMEEKERPGFEEALKKLETIVQQLENEEITLEDSVTLYEEGIQLSKFCTEILQRAELRIEEVNDTK